MVPIDPWRNSTPVFGAVAFCMTNIEDFRTPLMSTSSTLSSTYLLQKRSLRWTSSKRKIMAVIKVDQLEDTNNERLCWATLRTKTQIWKWPKRGRWPLLEDSLRWRTTFDGRWPFMEDDLQWKTTMRTTSKTKRTCTLLEGTRRWTYSALRYFF